MSANNRKVSNRGKKALLFVISVAFCSCIILFGFFGSTFAIVKFSSFDFLAKKYVFKIGAENSKTKTTLYYDKDTIVRNGITYVNFSYIADVCDFSVSGDKNEYRFLLRNTEDDKITVTIDKTDVDLSGVSIQMESPAFIYQNDVFLPYSFVDNYFEGISISGDEEDDHKFYITYSSDGSFGFTTHLPCECDNVAY